MLRICSHGALCQARRLLMTSSLRHQAPVAAEPFANGSSSVYLEEMYNAWLQEPNSVHKVSGRVKAAD